MKIFSRWQLLIVSVNKYTIPFIERALRSPGKLFTLCSTTAPLRLYTNGTTADHGSLWGRTGSWSIKIHQVTNLIPNKKPLSPANPQMSDRCAVCLSSSSSPLMNLAFFRQTLNHQKVFFSGPREIIGERLCAALMLPHSRPQKQWGRGKGALSLHRRAACFVNSYYVFMYTSQ